MPTVILDRIPLPSLQVYTTVSVVLLLCSVYYSFYVTFELEWKLEEFGINVERNNTFSDVYVYYGELIHEINVVKKLSNAIATKLNRVVYFMLQEPLCIWTLINMAYCCLVLMGKFIQKLVFGELRVSEQQHIKDKFWNFIFYKFIFIFGVMNVQFIEEVLLWCSWFSVIGFLHLLAQLCKDRFEYLSFSPTTPKGTHIKLLMLLCSILTLACGLIGICIFVGFQIGLNTFLFMTAECLLVTLRTLYVIIRYSIHLWDMNQNGAWEKRASYVYYTELVFEMTALILDFFHHFHMLVWGNIFLSMASLVILMQVRCLFYEIRHRLRKYKNYLRIVRHMETTYPLASIDELKKNSDDCAICWDHMDFARKLPCGHIFHNSCLRSWLEQDISCPTCRKSLTEADSPKITSNSNSLLDGNSYSQDNNQVSSHIFHFGPQYTSWWPNFSVEVTNLSHNREVPENTNLQLDNMAREVQRMFPNVNLNQIIEDLNITQSLEITIENILDGKFSSTVKTEMCTSEVNQIQTYEPAAMDNDTKSIAVCEVSTTDTITYSEDAIPSSEIEEEQKEKEILIPSFGGLGCRFSKSPEERETILSLRKDEMIKLARRKYINKIAVQNSMSESAVLVNLEQRINRNRSSSRNMLRSLFMRIREM